MDKTKLNKKGVIGLGQAPGVVILLVTLAIFLGVGALILSEMQDTTLTTTDATAVTNETMTAAEIVQGNNFTLDTNTGDQTGYVPIIAIVNNATSSWNTGNYTVISTGQVQWLNTTAIGEITGANISYTYTATDHDFAFNATRGGLQGLDTLASFQTVIAVIIAAALILGVVFLIRA